MIFRLFVTRYLFILFFGVILPLKSVYADEAFVVEDIRIEGLQRIDAGAIFAKLAIKVGQEANPSSIAQSVKTLYATGFFKDVRIERQKNILVVIVVERPTILRLNFDGNASFSADKLKEALKTIELSEGMIFDPSVLDRSEQEVQKLYFAQSRYNAVVKARAVPIERNRVVINFDIKEGGISKIRGIHFVGNRDFSDEVLLEEIRLTVPNWLTWWNKNDQYSKQKLNGDLELLRSFYLDRGYLEFAIDSTQVSISPGKQDIYITINLTEGAKFKVGDVKAVGDVPITQSELSNLIKLKKGEVFNQKLLIETSKAIGDRLGDFGYAFANVNAVPEINRENNTVAFSLLIDSGKRIYVRRINISGNTKTRDEVMRRDLRQLESAWYANDKINRSKQRLDRLQYFSDINVETPPVAGTSDQVDLNIKVTERPTGSMMVSAGLSNAEGVILGLSVSQNNFLGTGNRVTALVNTSRVNTVYSLSHTDPYFTMDGISRTVNIYRRDVDTAYLRTGTFKTSSYGTGISFGIPLNERDTFSVGTTFDYTKVDLQSNSALYYRKYCGRASSLGCENYSLLLTLGWAHDSRDNVLYPNSGTYQRINGEVGLPGFDLQYYRAEYKHSWYYPLISNQVTLMLNGEFGYGDTYGSKDFPFFKNFFMGGVNSLRGYRAGSVGLRDYDSVNKIYFYTGGTRRVLGNAEIYGPVPGLKDSSQFRISAFLDAGNIYTNTQTVDFSQLRYSAGVGASWFSPFGPIKLVFAKALNAEVTDRTEQIQFQMGTQF